VAYFRGCGHQCSRSRLTCIGTWPLTDVTDNSGLHATARRATVGQSAASGCEVAKCTRPCGKERVFCCQEGCLCAMERHDGVLENVKPLGRGTWQSPQKPSASRPVAVEMASKHVASYPLRTRYRHLQSLVILTPSHRCDGRVPFWPLLLCHLGGQLSRKPFSSR
jgi:hypothetical protein